MAGKTTNFTREGTPFDVFQIGKNYTGIKKQIELSLQQIYEDYLKEGVIYTLGKYENEFMSRMYLQRLIDLGIIKESADSKGNTQYKWDSDEDPDFKELTNRILTIIKT